MNERQEQTRIEEWIDRETARQIGRAMRAFNISGTEVLRRVIARAWFAMEKEELHGQLFITRKRRFFSSMRDVPISFKNITLPEDVRGVRIRVNINSQSETMLYELLHRFDKAYSLSDLIIWLVRVGTTVLFLDEKKSYLSYWNEENSYYEKILFVDHPH